MNIFSSNSLLGRFLYFVADLFILNILWLICSLPVFTIGASTTALYYSIMKRQRRNESYVHKNFFKAFKSNFKQSTIIWLILLIVGAVLCLDMRLGLVFKASGNAMGNLFIVISVILSIPYAFILIYIFPVQAKFENKVKDNLKNAVLMAIAHFGYTLLLLLIILSFIALTFISRAFIGVEILIGFSLLAFLMSNIFIVVFRKHLPNEFDDDLEAIGLDHQK